MSSSPLNSVLLSKLYAESDKWGNATPDDFTVRQVNDLYEVSLTNDPSRKVYVTQDGKAYTEATDAVLAQPSLSKPAFSIDFFEPNTTATESLYPTEFVSSKNDVKVKSILKKKKDAVDPSFSIDTIEPSFSVRISPWVLETTQSNTLSRTTAEISLPDRYSITPSIDFPFGSTNIDAINIAKKTMDVMPRVVASTTAGSMVADDEICFCL